jgi:hypothetical protein
MSDKVPYLRKALEQGLLVPFVGAGFSAQTAQLPSWPKLLEHGMDYAIDRHGVDPNDALVTEARRLADAGSLIDAFDLLLALLGGAAPGGLSLGFEAFLAEFFAEPEISSTDLLDALHYLRPRRLLTTNYDTLLEEWDMGGGRTITWRTPALMRDALRLGAGVIHIHGVWKDASSVILSKHSYEEIAADAPARQIAQTIFHSGILMFVGTSLDGTHDPHLGDLLAEFQSLADPLRGETSPHIMLVRGRVDGDLRARLNHQGIEPVSYGAEYRELARFIRSLGDSSTVELKADPFAAIMAAVRRSPSLDDALRAIGNWITSDVLLGRRIRVSFSEKIQTGNETSLRRRAVIPSSSSGNPHHYPLSISAWSLVEGRPICWPQDADRAVDVAWLRRFGKLDAVDALINAPGLDAHPQLSTYTDVDRIRAAWATGALVLRDFFQDWSSDQPRPHYNQFISVPVPWIESASPGEDVPEYGVFNVDSLDPQPLSDRRVMEHLKLAAGLATIAFELHGGARAKQVPAERAGFADRLASLVGRRRNT